MANEAGSHLSASSGAAAFDARAFRRALGQFATGVAIVTAHGGAGEAIGLTMSSFNSVSIDPPLILFSADRKALSLPAMLVARGYAVNILSRGQEHLSNQFARAQADKWAAVASAPGHAEAPLLHGALAHFECEPYAHYDGGDHVIFVGKVIRFSTPADLETQPLLFFRGKYHGVDGEGERAPLWPLPIHY
ncbi:flavin reductase family protein [Phreatobacter stygius]|uniref:Flavin reductase family protein n=1 Tax=Phreatobacter stygius TaxID=1940610 RepID=A0A4D7B578_9HYPH|nr:flavin reductase family protein [Phreatobacter stygius]QCI65250.1 flavin reductase family protein [Phreatobacter stygius]